MSWFHFRDSQIPLDEQGQYVLANLYCLQQENFQPISRAGLLYYRQTHNGILKVDKAGMLSLSTEVNTLKCRNL